MERERGTETLSFVDALQREAERCRESLPLQHRVYSYLARGYYSEQIRRLWQYFPRSQTLFLKTAELKCEPQKTMDRVFTFLEVQSQPVKPLIVHARNYPAPMSDQARELLIDAYAWEIRETARLLDWNPDEWLDANRTGR